LKKKKLFEELQKIFPNDINDIKALDLAKRVGKTTCKEINPLLYSLAKENKIEKTHNSNPAKWKALTGPNSTLPIRQDPHTTTFQDYLLKIANQESNLELRNSLDQQIRECKNNAEVLFKTQNKWSLSFDEIWAVNLYSFGHVKSQNRYLFQLLNTALQSRIPEKREIWKEYIKILTMAMNKLPTSKTTTYRGIPEEEPFNNKYEKNQIVTWSGFTSTSSNLERAKTFAENNGVIIEIVDLWNGKVISNYSCYPREEEILLPPEQKFVVVDPLHSHSDGYRYVKLSHCKSDEIIY